MARRTHASAPGPSGRAAGPSATISFLSDYGTRDEFVGVVKSVIREIAPDARVIDITHEIEPHDVRAGALTLVRSAQYLAPGVVLAVVDPGVGTDRRRVAVEVGGGQSYLVGPDNGLLAPCVGMVGGADRAVELDNTDLHLPAPGATFDGRDVFAPAAAHLAAGTDLAELGTAIDPAGLRPGVLPLSRREGDAVMGQVLWVDRFGNAQLNVGPDELDEFEDRVGLRWGENRRSALRAAAYAELGVGELGLVVDSYGLLAVSLNGHHAAGELGLGEGDEVVIEPLSGDEDRVGTPVTLDQRR